MTEDHKYCAYPFYEIYSDNASRYRLCCFATTNKTIKKYDALNTLPFEYFLSEEMEQIRQDMVEGKRVHGCEHCYNLEDRGRPSPRISKYNVKFPPTADVDKIDLKLRIGGSHCNLGCYMCIPVNSSYRRMELKQSGIDQMWKAKKGSGADPNDLIPGIGFSFDDDPKNVSTRRFDEIVDNIIENIDRVGNIKFIGGEPIIIPRMWDIIDRIPNDKAKDISVTFQTNLTNLHYKNHSVFDIRNKFKKLEMHVSADHYGDKLSWVRYPIDVKQFEKNLVDAYDMLSGIACTTGILNILDLYEIRDYYKDNFNLRVDFNNVVTNPVTLSCKNLKDKEELLEKYSGKEFEMVYNELLKDRDEREAQQGYFYCLKLSQHRKTNFPEMFSDVAQKIL